MPSALSRPIGHAGLGLRRENIDDLLNAPAGQVDFLEIAPENWMGLGGRYREQLEQAAARYPIICHGLSLSIGGPAELDLDFLRNLKVFLDRHRIAGYSEHLSYCTDDGHLYDLLPIPFTEEAVHYTAARIRRVQDILERPLAIENISYYAAPGQRMDEASFVRAVLDEADCRLLLDVNNIWVNSVNHGYNPHDFLRTMPAQRIDYLHVAGHLREDDGQLIDTHGMPVNDPVWQLLGETYATFGVFPTLLERDFNLPPFDELLAEIDTIRRLQAPHLTQRDRHAASDRQRRAG
jgi:hypothetical protein